MWAIGEAASGGPDAEDTYLLIASGSSNVAQLRVTVIGDNGTKAQREFTLAGWQRLTVFVQEQFPEIEDQRFSVLVESLPGVSPPLHRPITVEYARYQSTARPFGRAGGAALATRVR